MTTITFWQEAALWTGNDVAAQLSMIVSTAAWRRLVRPHLEPLFAAGKARGLWVAFHCCGPVIGDLAGMGLDVLNPIQRNCPGMDPFELKAEFGERLAFMGGGLILAASHTVPPEVLGGRRPAEVGVGRGWRSFTSFRMACLGVWGDA